MKEEAGSGGEPSDGGWDVDDDIELPPGLDNSGHYVSQAGPHDVTTTTTKPHVTTT